MERLGHRSERMAMRYQHAATERMRQLAYGMGGRLGGRLAQLRKQSRKQRPAEFARVMAVTGRRQCDRSLG